MASFVVNYICFDDFNPKKCGIISMYMLLKYFFTS